MIVVTGGAGFIGSAFVARLNSEGIDDIIIVDHLGESAKWKNLLGKRFLSYLHKDDFMKRAREGKLPSTITAIVHMGACSATTEQDVDYLWRNNFEYTKVLAEYSLDRSIRFIYASSGATYGDGAQGYSDHDDVTPSLRPLNPYGFSKQMFDLLVLRNGWQNSIVGLKFFNVYGPNEYHKGHMHSVVLKAYREAKAEGVIKLFRSYRPEFPDGGQKRDHVYVKDCVEAMLWFLRNPGSNGIFNIGTGSARTWNELANAVFKALGQSPRIEYIEMPERLVKQYQYFTQASTEKLRALGSPITFRSLDDGVADYVQNYLEKNEISW